MVGIVFGSAAVNSSWLWSKIRRRIRPDSMRAWPLAHLRDVDDAELALGRAHRSSRSMNWLLLSCSMRTIVVMFAAGREGFHVLLVASRLQDSPDHPGSGRLVAVLVDEVDELLPATLVEPAQLADVLLVLAFWAESDRDDVRRAQSPDVELDAAGDERLVEVARAFVAV